MKRFFAASAWILFVSSVQAELKIVATTPDLADLARTIGGDMARVESLSKGTEDLHAVPQRPSFIPKLAQADGVVHLGLGAEHSFLPALIEASANADLQPGKKGDIDCSVYVTPMDVPAVISRGQGEQHPDGNPHYNIDPRKGRDMSRAIAEGFSRLDPKNAAVYEKNRRAFDAALSEKLSEWSGKTSRLKGTKAVSYHKDMIYFADFLGIALIGEVEPKPGVASSPRHLAGLVETMRREKAALILFEIQYSDGAAKWLARETGARIAAVATMGGAFPDSATYFGMIERNINAVLEALK